MNQLTRYAKSLDQRIRQLERAPWPAAVSIEEEDDEVSLGGLFLLVEEGADTRLYARISRRWTALALLANSPYNSASGAIAGYGQILMATRSDDTVNVSSDRGSTFTTQAEPISGQDVDMSGVDRSGVVWAVSETGADPVWSLWKSANLGASWTEVQADFEFIEGLAFGTPGQIAAWDVSSFASSLFSGQVRLSDDNGASFVAEDTTDTVANANQRITPLGVHYLDSGRIALTYTFRDVSGTPTAEARAVYLDSGSWTTPVVITSLTGSSPGWHATTKGTEIAVTLYGGAGAIEIYTSPDSVTWTELAVVPGDVTAELAYDTEGVLHALTSEGLFAYVNGAWVADTAAPVAYGVFGVPQ